MVPLARGGDAGMDASGTAVAAALLGLLGPGRSFDLIDGDVRLPRIAWATPAEALAALGALTRGRRVGRKSGSAAMSVAAAAACAGPQGVEARRLQGGGLDESLGFIESRADHPPHAPRALLLNTRRACGGGGGGAEVAAAAAGELEALGELDPRTDFELWELYGGAEPEAAAAALADAEADAGAGDEADEGRRAAAAREALLVELRHTLGVRRLPMLTELEAYRCAAGALLLRITTMHYYYYALLPPCMHYYYYALLLHALYYYGYYLGGYYLGTGWPTWLRTSTSPSRRVTC